MTGFENPFRAETAKPKTFLERICSPARAKVIAGLLMVATPSIEACSAGAALGRGPLTSIHKGDRPDDPELPNFGVMIDQLKAAIGEDVLSAEMNMHEAYTDNFHERKNPLQLENFDKMDIEEKALRDLLSIYPHSWTSNVSKISVNPRLIPMPYPGFEGEAEYGHCKKSWQGNPIEIEFTSETLKDTGHHNFHTRLEMLKSISHELAHGSDAGSNVKLDAKQSLSLMYMTLVAVSDPGRPKFSYPESIKIKPGQDKKSETEARMTEYFAELMAMAFLQLRGDSWETWKPEFKRILGSEKGASPQAAEWNYKLVKDYFQWSEPGYQIWKAGPKLWDQAVKIENIRALHGFERALPLIPDKDIVARLDEILKDKTTQSKEAQYQYMKLDEMFRADIRAVEKCTEPKEEQRREVIRIFDSMINNAMSVRNFQLDLSTNIIRLTSGEEVAERIKYFMEEYDRLDTESKEVIKNELLKRLQIAKEKAPPDFEH
ncbi:MAG: hypothetical protein WC750_03120 [Patescibacteria group bacterium]|jgi:hypothetical protein